MEIPNPKDFGFTDESLALIERHRYLARQNPAAPLAPWEVEVLGKQICSKEFGEDFQILRATVRGDTGFAWVDKKSGYLNEDGVTYSYTKHGLISVFDGQPDVVKVSVTTGKQTCYYVFDRTTLTVIPERTIIHTTGET